jgi:hypothetical protein
MFLLDAGRYCVHACLRGVGTRGTARPVVGGGRTVVGVVTVPGVIAIRSALPGNVASVTFGFAAFFTMDIVNADHSDTTIAVGTLLEVLLAVTVDSLEVKVMGSRRQRLVAIEAPPFYWRSIDADEPAFISSNLNFGYTVDDDFEGALSISGTTRNVGVNVLRTISVVDGASPVAVLLGEN